METVAVYAIAVLVIAAVAGAGGIVLGMLLAPRVGRLVDRSDAPDEEAGDDDGS